MPMEVIERVNELGKAQEIPQALTFTDCHATEIEDTLEEAGDHTNDEFYTPFEHNESDSHYDADDYDNSSSDDDDDDSVSSHTSNSSDSVTSQISDGLHDIRTAPPHVEPTEPSNPHSDDKPPQRLIP
mmetsp:Transcript_24362/g.34847  ORF Transcript_24362/g.34847 Transcript_24362/m.34847 type:complete len:128 (+) Transcript_24362:59-442(+)